MAAFFPKIENLADVRSIARGAAGAGLVFAGMLAFGFALILYGNAELVMGEEPGNGELIWLLSGIGIEIGLVLFFVWRVSTGKGYVSAILLLLLFLIEAAAKITSGTTNAGWMIAYLFISIGLLHGIRATLAFKKMSKLETATSEF